MGNVPFIFANGRPNHGLLILRLIIGTALIARCFLLGKDGVSLQTIAPNVIAAGAGLFLLFGLWTFVAGTILAIGELLIAFSQGHDPWTSLLLSSLGVAIALLGPGTWSLDARLSGWKRIEIRPPHN